MDKKLKSKISTWFMLVVLITQTLTPVASVFANDTATNTTNSSQITSSTLESTSEGTILATTGTSAPATSQTQSSSETTVETTAPTSQSEETPAAEEEASAEDEEPAREELGGEGKQLRAIPNDLGVGIFKNIDIKIGDESLEPEATNKIELTDGLQLRTTFDWVLDDAIELSSGDWAEFPLPVILQGVAGRTTGDLFDENGTVVGTYEITENDKLKVTFNDELVGKTERAGKVGLLLEFNLNAFEEDVNQKLEFGESINKDFDIKVKPQGEVHSLKKYGNANEKINPTYIDWRLDVNTTLEELTNGSVEDIIPTGLELDFTSIEIHELKVGSEGKLTLGDKVTPNVIETSTGFKVELGKTDKAYRITYKTNITEFKETYQNDAVLKDNDELIKQDLATVDGLSQGSLIEKEGWVRQENKNQIYWRLYVNKAESNLKDVRILDEIPAGLNVESIKAWKLVKSGNNWNYGEKVGEYTEFPVELGDIQEAYVFEIITDIDYGHFTEYTKEIEFHNIAKLELNGKETAEDDATVPVKRGSLIVKTGKETTDYGDSKISWTITVNEAKHHIDNAVITDTIGDGLEFMEGTLKVKDSKGVDVTLPKDAFKQTATGFTLSLSDITDKYTITYDTKIIGKLPEGQTGYKNKATLSGGNLGGTGVGEGDLNKEPEVKPSVNNTYSKNLEWWIEKGGILYNGIDYKEKTFSWKLAVDAKKEEITELKITDHFEPEKSMKFLKDSLRVIMGKEVLKENIDYELVDKGVDGFELEFIGTHKPLKRATYEIYYKTSFDPNIVLAANGKLNEETKYTNHATYIGKTKDVEGNYNQFEIPVKADYWVDKDYVASGKKAGTLNREERTISWKIYTNASGRDLTGAPFVIADKLVAGNQTINEDVKVYEYSLKEDGSQIKGSEVTKGFTLSYDKDQKGFSATFEDGVKVPVLVEFTSKVNGKSEEWYKNQAIVTDKTEVKKTYDASVKYENYNSFVSKQALNVDGNKVYTDDEIEWKVGLNESLSNIKNAVFKDEMSKGLVLLEDSIKVYKGSISEANLVNLSEGAVTVAATEDGGTNLAIELGNVQETRYYVTYTTVVIATNGKINNQASLSGYDENLGTSGKKAFDATQASWGTGSGKENRGQIEIVKVDSETKEAITAPAKFELYYLLNGEKQVVTGEVQQTQNGKIQYGNLPFRTYYLKEVEAPEGYQILEEAIEIIVDKDHKNIEFKVENTKIPDKTYAIGDYTWIDANGNGLQDANEQVLPGVKVDLYDETGKTLL
ncbi:MAG: collagen binding domain-containing protein, partial [Enterococcus lemanii]